MPEKDDDGRDAVSQEISAMIAMIDYLMPQARRISPVAAFGLGMARHELSIAEATRDRMLVPFLLRTRITH